MDKNFNSRIKQKKDTAANWQKNNPVLLDGEMIIVETNDGVRLKVGNGTSAYSALPFVEDKIDCGTF